VDSYFSDSLQKQSIIEFVSYHWTKISFKKNQRIYAFTNKTAWNAGEIRETITLPVRAAIFGKAQTAEDSEMFYDP
jgi:hypothetical protein